jgi:hypothetical protein
VWLTSFIGWASGQPQSASVFEFETFVNGNEIDNHTNVVH